MAIGGGSAILMVTGRGMACSGGGERSSGMDLNGGGAG